MSQFDLQALGLDLNVQENEVREVVKLEPLPAGTFGGRLVGVVEVGTHPGFDKEKTKDEVILVFQLFGKLVPEAKDKDGNPISRLDYFRLNKTFSSKGTFLEVFNRMNYEGTALNLFQFLGKAFRIKRTEYKKQDGSIGVKIEKDGILSPMVEVLDEDGMPTGEFKSMKVPEATEPFQVFQWANGNQAQFDTLPFWMQNTIKQALNLAGSPAEGLKMKEDPKKAKEASEAPAEEVRVAPKPVSKAAAQAEDEFEF